MQINEEQVVVAADLNGVGSYYPSVGLGVPVLARGGNSDSDSEPVIQRATLNPLLANLT